MRTPLDETDWAMLEISADVNPGWSPSRLNAPVEQLDTTPQRTRAADWRLTTHGGGPSVRSPLLGLYEVMSYPVR